MPLDLVSTTLEKVHVKLNPTDSTGNPSTVEPGSVVWTVTSGGATVTPDADGLGAFFISEDITGSSTWGVSADADLGAGVDTISDSGTYTYNHPNAANLGLTADPAQPKP